MSLNDPQWGKRPGGGSGNQGPPDLDELWRTFSKKFNKLFARHGTEGNGSGSGEPPSFKQLGSGIGLLLGLILVVWLTSAFILW